MQIEIVNPMGAVAYRRPQGHPDVAEALKTTGYSVRFTLPPEADYTKGWELLDVTEPQRYWMVIGLTTRRMVVWSIGYRPTTQEGYWADTWANEAPTAASTQMNLILACLPAPVPEEAEPSGPEQLIHAAARNEALMDECLAMLSIPALSKEQAREMLRGVCTHFALTAFGIEQPGQATAEPPPAAPVFPAKDALAWHFPSMVLVRIGQQHDAFEWEVRTHPFDLDHKDGRFVIASRANLEELSEGEQREIEAGKRLAKPHCRSDNDGHCTWRRCPQQRDHEPEATGRHCPYHIANHHEEI